MITSAKTRAEVKVEAARNAPPVILYVCTGLPYLINAVWSIRSLRRFSYPSIEVVVGNEEEREFIQNRFPEVPCRIQLGDRKGYPAFSYKPFALLQYMKTQGLATSSGNVVVCDADILWKQDPLPLFQRFENRYWFHKITSVDPKDFDRELREVPDSNIGLITSLHYKRQRPMRRYPNFRLNAGLFMVPRDQFLPILEKWMEEMFSLPPSEMLMSEAILSHVYAELGLKPESDDVKYHGQLPRDGASQEVWNYEQAVPPPTGQFTGYQTAKHYFSHQRKDMISDVLELGLDEDGFAPTYRRLLFKQKIKRNLNRISTRLRECFS